MRRGFTLIEALAATVLLAIIVIACLLFFQSASNVLAERDGSVEETALVASAVSQIMASPEWESRPPSGAVTFAWPSGLAEAASSTRLSGKPIRVELPNRGGDELETQDDTTPSRATTPSDRVESGAGESGEAKESAAARASESAVEGAHDSQPRSVVGDWIAFRCGDVVIHRWIERPASTRSRRRVSRRRSSVTRVTSPRRSLPRARGMTLVELVAALAIVGSLAVAATAWTVGATELAASSRDRSNRLGAAEAVFQLIGDDLRSSDMDTSQTRRSGAARSRLSGSSGGQAEPRVRIDGDTIVIATRHAVHAVHAVHDAHDVHGAPYTLEHEHRYSVDSASSRLMLSAPGREPRVLVDGVTALRTTYMETERLLTVAIEIAGLGETGRSFVVP